MDGIISVHDQYKNRQVYQNYGRSNQYTSKQFTFQFIALYRRGSVQPCDRDMLTTVHQPGNTRNSHITSRATARIIMRELPGRQSGFKNMIVQNHHSVNVQYKFLFTNYSSISIYKLHQYIHFGTVKLNMVVCPCCLTLHTLGLGRVDLDILWYSTKTTCEVWYP